MRVDLCLCSAMFTQEFFPCSALKVLSLFTLIMVNAPNDYDRFLPAYSTEPILDSFLTISFQIFWHPNDALCIHLNTVNAGENSKSSEVGLRISIDQIRLAGQKKCLTVKKTTYLLLYFLCFCILFPVFTQMSKDHQA